MPIDKRQSHSNIVKELIDEYKSSGKIGNTYPKDMKHAQKIANAIAYKIKDEAVLEEIKRINEEEAKQLSLDFQKNVKSYLHEIARTNEYEISLIVNKFISAYLALEKARLKRLEKPIDLPNLSYSHSNLIYSALEDVGFPIGYNQRIGYLNANSAEKASQRTNHFYCRVQDSNLIVTINTEYMTEIKMNTGQLSTIQ